MMRRSEQQWELKMDVMDKVDEVHSIGFFLNEI